MTLQKEKGLETLISLVQFCVRNNNVLAVGLRAGYSE